MKVKIKLPDKVAPKDLRGFGVNTKSGSVNIYYYSSNLPKYVCKAVSGDGIEFEKGISDFSLTGLKQETDDPSGVLLFRFSKIKDEHFLSYGLKKEHGLQAFLAKSKDQKNWETFAKMPPNSLPGLIVENYQYKNSYIMYAGGKDIAIGASSDGVKWKFSSLKLPAGNGYTVDYVLKTETGIFLIYHTYSDTPCGPSLEIKTINFDLDNPKKILWKSDSSIWPEPEIWRFKNNECLGFVNFKGRLLSYWNVENLGIYLIAFPVYETEKKFEKRKTKLLKHPENPILSPVAKNEWESEAVFNPAAFYEDGKVYLLYRAVGHEYVSVLGYAESSDGVHFEKRLEDPVYKASEAFEIRCKNFKVEKAQKYMSGGGYGGCEDPRITKIGNRLYMIYVAFNGYEPPRLAMTSISYKNFINHKFLWEKPVLISPPGVVDKSGCVLPEKINGKYVVFHRIYPNILIDYVDNLKFDGKTWLKGEFSIGPRPTMWDSRKVGVGAPPLKTDDGWLLIYQGVGEQDSSKYKIGAMLLDLQDPTKVTHRTNHPIIEPTEHYENNLAKFGVVYPCGAVIIDGQLFVYYGGSDSVTCVATANLKEFLTGLKEHEAADMEILENHG